MASFDFLDNILNLYLFHVPTFLCIKEIFNAGHILPSYTPTFLTKQMNQILDLIFVNAIWKSMMECI